LKKYIKKNHKHRKRSRQKTLQFFSFRDGNVNYLQSMMQTMMMMLI